MTEAQKNIVAATEAFVQEQLRGAEGGHDWFHVRRVYLLSQKLAHEEGADCFVVTLAALLHDVADAKFHQGDESIGPRIAEEFLQKIGVEERVIQKVVFVIRYISFKGGHNPAPYRTAELDVVQDADRLDALGAVGIARCFNYGGFKNRPLYDPDVPPNLKMDKETYKKGDSPSLNHFYEKLLLLKDQMQTRSGRALAVERHQFLELFLSRFLDEWEGKI